MWPAGRKSTAVGTSYNELLHRRKAELFSSLWARTTTLDAMEVLL
jgi:hypothetical protein